MAGAGGSSRRAGGLSLDGLTDILSLDVLTDGLSLDGLTDDLSLDVLMVDWMRSAGAICRPRGGGIYPLSQVLFSRFSAGFRQFQHGFRQDSDFPYFPNVYKLHIINCKFYKLFVH